MEINIPQLRSFVGVVEHGGFAAAATAVGLTPSAVSKHVSALEQQLGARLFDRTTRSVRVTPVGQAYYERVSAVLVDLDDAVTSVSSAAGLAAGRLRLSAPMDFGRARLAAALAAFCRQWPLVSLDIELTDRYVDIVREGFDVALRIGALPDTTLVARPVARFSRVLVASPGYLERQGIPRLPADLESHRCINFSLERERVWPFLDSPQGRRTQPRERHRVNNGDMICALVMAGEGIAFLPDFIVQDGLDDGRLARLLPEQAESELVLHALYPHRRLLSATIRLFLEHLVAYFHRPAEATPPRRAL